MSDLQDLIKRLRVETATPTSYIYYDKSDGKIQKISSKNVPEENVSIFPVATEEALPILTGEKRTDEYIIFYDVSTKQVRLKEVAYDDSYNSASTMCYQLPVIRNINEGHSILEQIYDGVNVYIYDASSSYNKGQCVWYKENVYKLKTDVVEDFNPSEHILYVEDVSVTELPTQTHVTQKLAMIPEYVGVHVDVWYDEVSHLAGQHVWINGTVYRLTDDQEINTRFTMDNATIVVRNVKLYDDRNKTLPMIKSVSSGDTILNNNSIYSVRFVDQEFNKDKVSIFFYTNINTLLYYNNNEYYELDLTDISENIHHKEGIELTYTDITTLKNGQKILSGNQLYQLQIGKDYDVIVQQNTQDKTWKMIINPYTKKFLISSGYKSTEKLYFSITSKYDPNILYRSLEFTVDNLLHENESLIPFIYDIESNEEDVSIYTVKYFDSYAHEAI
jgi:hypothetical protein